jgi:hypothetical protein
MTNTRKPVHISPPINLSEQDIDATITTAEYTIINNHHTICALTLRNGYVVTGEAGCANHDTFQPAVGRGLAREAARKKVWELEGYLLREKIYQDSKGKKSV